MGFLVQLGNTLFALNLFYYFMEGAFVMPFLLPFLPIVLHIIMRVYQLLQARKKQEQFLQLLKEAEELQKEKDKTDE